jgi:hypothetical protein
MSGMRTVSFFGPERDGIGGGDTEADNGRETAGGFGGGKKFVDEISEGSGCGEEGTGRLPVLRIGNWIRTVSRGLTLGSGGSVEGGCGNSMRTVSFFGWSGSAIRGGEIDQKSWTCHESILQLTSRNMSL